MPIDNASGCDGDDGAKTVTVILVLMLAMMLL